MYHDETFVIEGVLVHTEFFLGDEEWDVTAVEPYTRDVIPAGKEAVLVWPVVKSKHEGWWMWLEDFKEKAEPVSAGAKERLE